MTVDPNPLALAVIAAQEKAAQARMVENALRESTPAERAHHGPITSPGDRIRMRGVPITAVGVGGTQLGTNPLTEVLRRQDMRDRQRRRDTIRPPR